jgi:hypothetical protein
MQMMQRKRFSSSDLELPLTHSNNLSAPSSGSSGGSFRIQPQQPLGRSSSLTGNSTSSPLPAATKLRSTLRRKPPSSSRHPMDSHSFNDRYHTTTSSDRFSIFSVTSDRISFRSNPHQDRLSSFSDRYHYHYPSGTSTSNNWILYTVAMTTLILLAVTLYRYDAELRQELYHKDLQVEDYQQHAKVLERVARALRYEAEHLTRQVAQLEEETNPNNNNNNRADSELQQRVLALEHAQLQLHLGVQQLSKRLLREK